MTSEAEVILNQLGMRIANVGEREISASCPFHEDRHPSFSMNIETHLWICYQCGESGTLTMLLQKVKGGDKVNTAALFRGVGREALSRKLKRREEPEPELAPPIDPLYLYAQWRGFSDPPEAALGARDINPDWAAFYGVKWKQGWIMPIWDPLSTRPEEGLWGWQFKRLSFVSNYPISVKKSTTLFGVHEIGYFGSKAVVLVESPLDVVHLASAGVAAVSSFGAAVSKAQVRLLVEVCDRVVLALDNDKAGRAATVKLYPKLARFIPTRRAILPAGVKDPGDMDYEQIRSVFGDLQGDPPSISGGGGQDDARPPVAPTGTRSRSG